MKKMIIAMILVVVIAITGCGIDNTPLQLWKAVKDSESILAKYTTEIDDDAFWGSARTAAELISNTLEPTHDYRVEVWLRTDENEPIIVESPVTVQFSNDDWRELWYNQILITLATDDSVVEAHKAGKTVRVTGSVLEFFDSPSDGLKELCDSDNDGSWDDPEGGGR